MVTGNAPQSSLPTTSMAFGGGAVTVPAVVHTAVTPSSTVGSDSGSSGSAADSTDYFFGFIVTFVVLLLLFVSCGLGSRRRSALLRPLWARNLETDHDGADFGSGGLFLGDRPGWGQGKSAQLTRPVCWETWLLPRPDERISPQWKDLQPISATFVRPTSSVGLRGRSKISSPTSLPLSAAADSRSPAASQPSLSVLTQPSWYRCHHPLPRGNACRVRGRVHLRLSTRRWVTAYQAGMRSASYSCHGQAAKSNSIFAFLPSSYLLVKYPIMTLRYLTFLV
ncbi:hypothetical protein F5J12DRAFT_496825 [Pisolithus orientalis]|uniref:uncharacterized protein n=1 Tax=Pisolithus orientalis TaxID=936130 RepID=UPI002224F7DF|nr:uncharacterized protein F5J12DRAFT_496825 [Pisolithus orientalis]KAI6019979.1 hypothetical protein F5J12DRAFT_496825 [Pisolithus orientalis]